MGRIHCCRYCNLLAGTELLNHFNSLFNRYLLENHHGARFDDLKTGLAFLRRKVSTHDEGPLAFMKSNVSSVVSCLEALEALRGALEKDVQVTKNFGAVKCILKKRPIDSS